MKVLKYPKSSLFCQLFENVAICISIVSSNWPSSVIQFVSIVTQWNLISSYALKCRSCFILNWSYSKNPVPFCSSKLKYACGVSFNTLYRIQTWQVLFYQFHDPINNGSISRNFLSASSTSWCHAKNLFTWLLLLFWSCCEFWLLTFITGPSPENCPHLVTTIPRSSHWPMMDI